eukprot:2211243-Rhodomonas_salina.1
MKCNLKHARVDTRAHATRLMRARVHAGTGVEARGREEEGRRGLAGLPGAEAAVDVAGQRAQATARALRPERHGGRHGEGEGARLGRRRGVGLGLGVDGAGHVVGAEVGVAGDDAEGDAEEGGDERGDEAHLEPHVDRDRLLVVL